MEPVGNSKHVLLDCTDEYETISGDEDEGTEYDPKSR